MNLNNRKAITLLEVIVTTAIFTSVLAGIYATFITGKRSWELYNQNVSYQRNLRGGMIAIARELREANNILITKEEGKLLVSFYRSGIGVVNYTWQNSGPKALQIIRKDPEKEKILAHGISSLIFYQEADGLFFDLEAQETNPGSKPGNFHLKMMITPRMKTKMFNDPRQNDV